MTKDVSHLSTVPHVSQFRQASGTTFAPSGTPEGYITRITPESIHGIGPWNE
jgi:hypothetical protein